MADNAKTDSLFYQLFLKWPQKMLAMLGLANANSAYQFISVEIKQTAFRIDGIFKPIDTDQNLPIIFVEVQFQPDPDFYGRLYSEIMLYLYQHKPNRSWLAVVIYPTRNLERSPNIEHLCLVNSLHTKLIYLEDFQNHTEPDLVLFRLIVCPESETADLVQTILKQTDPTEQNVIEFVETILVYKFPRLSREEIRTMLGFNNIELKQTRFYQEIAEEERQVAKNQLVLRLLEKRFSPLPSWVPDQLKQANDEQLDLLAERLLDAKTLAEVFQ